MIKIAYCIHSLHRSAGMERVLSVKANLLAAMPDYEVHIITANLNRRKPAFELKPEICVKDLGINENLHFRKYAKALCNVLNEIKPDICISMGGPEIYALPQCNDGSIKISEFHFSHDKFYLKYGNSHIGRLYAGWRTRKLENAVEKLDGFVVLTKGDRDDWMKRVNVQVSQIYNPLTFTCSEEAALESGKCIAIGRLDAQKNFGDLIAAWRKVAIKLPGKTLEIYGEGRLRKELEKEIRRLGLEDSVKLMGKSCKIKDKLLGSDCIAMSSRFEGFPMVLLEAAACGVPMLSYDCKRGPAEIIEDGANGRLVDFGDTDKLADAIIEVLSDSTLRHKMGKAAKLTSERFSPEIIIGEWDKYFRQLLNAKGQQKPQH